MFRLLKWGRAGKNDRTRYARTAGIKGQPYNFSATVWAAGTAANNLCRRFGIGAGHLKPPKRGAPNHCAGTCGFRYKLRSERCLAFSKFFFVARINTAVQAPKIVLLEIPERDRNLGLS